MSGALRLAWRYVSYHKVRSAILVLCIALVCALPIAVQALVETQAQGMTARARSTPLVAGAKGSRYDLILNALYFRGRVPGEVAMAEAQAIAAGGLAEPIPILSRQRAQGFAVVGTTPDYYRFRGLRAAHGSIPLTLGDATLGAEAARTLGVDVGDHVQTDAGNLYDLGLSYPLRMKVVGVLAAAGTPDDHAVFVDIKTAWIIEGIGHGHRGPGVARPERVLEREESNVIFNAGLFEYNEITAENIGSFHFHGDRSAFPLTAILVLPRDARSATKLKAQFRLSKGAQVLVPLEVVEEIFGFVMRVKVFFDAHVALVAVATGLFLLLIVLLVLRVRRRELETLERIGIARGAVALLLALEWSIIVAAGLLVAAAVAWGLLEAVRGAWVL